jgi:hypothetical protein
MCRWRGRTQTCVQGQQCQAPAQLRWAQNKHDLHSLNMHLIAVLAALPSALSGSSALLGGCCRPPASSASLPSALFSWPRHAGSKRQGSSWRQDGGSEQLEAGSPSQGGTSCALRLKIHEMHPVLVRPGTRGTCRNAPPVLVAVQAAARCPTRLVTPSAPAQGSRRPRRLLERWREAPPHRPPKPPHAACTAGPQASSPIQTIERRRPRRRERSCSPSRVQNREAHRRLPPLQAPPQQGREACMPSRQASSRTPMTPRLRRERR